MTSLSEWDRQLLEANLFRPLPTPHKVITDLQLLFKSICSQIKCSLALFMLQDSTMSLKSQLEAAAEQGYYKSLVASFAAMPEGAERCYAMAEVLKTGENIKKFERAYVHHLKCHITPGFGQQPAMDESNPQVRDVMYTILMYIVGVKQD